MPSEKVLEQKKKLVAELTEKLKASHSGVFVEYKGISVADDTKLRRELREAGVDYAVVKNTLLSRAVEDAGLEGLSDVFKGSTAVALSGDYTAPARILSGFAEKNKAFRIKAGFVDGTAVGAKSVEELSKLPPREVLVARVLGGLNAPIAGFANVLGANLSGLVRALNAVAQQKSA